MNRRGFLATCLGGAAAVVVAPMLGGHGKDVPYRRQSPETYCVDVPPGMSLMVSNEFDGSNAVCVCSAVKEGRWISVPDGYRYVYLCVNDPPPHFNGYNLRYIHWDYRTTSLT